MWKTRQQKQRKNTIQNTNSLRSKSKIRKQKSNMPQSRPPNLRAYRVSSPVRAFIWRWKYVALALMFATATHTLISVIKDEGIGNIPVLVAKNEITIGDTFTPANTITKYFPKDAIPDNSLTSVAKINGKSASTTIPRGLPITSHQILDEKYLANAPAGMVITSVKLQDNISTQLLQPGNKIELYAPAAAKGEPAKLVASNAIVVGKPANATKSSFFSQTPETTTLYIAIRKIDANLILGIQANTPLQAVIMKT